MRTEPSCRQEQRDTRATFVASPRGSSTFRASSPHAPGVCRYDGTYAFPSSRALVSLDQARSVATRLAIILTFRLLQRRHPRPEIGGGHGDRATCGRRRPVYHPASPRDLLRRVATTVAWAVLFPAVLDVGRSCGCGRRSCHTSSSSLLDDFFTPSEKSSVKPRVRLRGDGVEEKEALRTCQELLAVDLNVSTITHSQMFNVSTYKLNVIYPSRSESYRLNTSVMRFRLMHACTNKSKLNTFCRSPSSPLPRE